MTLDPRVAVFLSAILAVSAFLGGAGSYFADLGMSPQEVKALLAGDALLLGIGNSVLAALSAIPSTAEPDTMKKCYLGPKAPTS